MLRADAPCQSGAMQRTVDYSAFDEPADPAAVRAFRRDQSGGGFGFSLSPVAGTVLVGLVVSFIVVVAVVVIGANLTLGSLGGRSPVASLLGGAVVAVPFTIVVVSLIVRLARGGFAGGTGWRDRYRLDRFARANGFVYAHRSPAPQYPGMIFQRGSGRQSRDHLRSSEGRFVDFGNYRYTTGSGKNRRTRSWGFLAIHLDRALPHMVLDAKANDQLLASSLPLSLGREQRLSLEGDFDRHFTLYCPREYERDALYVFTPDLMALLIDEAGAFDVEIVDQWLFVYSPTPLPMGRAAVVQRMLRIVDTVGAKALSRTDRYRDDRVGDFGANTVAPQGRRLKRGVPALFIVVAVAVIGWQVLAALVSR